MKWLVKPYKRVESKGKAYNMRSEERKARRWGTRNLRRHARNKKAVVRMKGEEHL
jgi:hypothetical protein